MGPPLSLQIRYIRCSFIWSCAGLFRETTMLRGWRAFYLACSVPAFPLSVPWLQVLRKLITNEFSKAQLFALNHRKRKRFCPERAGSGSFVSFDEIVARNFTEFCLLVNGKIRVTDSVNLRLFKETHNCTSRRYSKFRFKRLPKFCCSKNFLYV